jgi:hypothetical protein
MQIVPSLVRHQRFFFFLGAIFRQNEKNKDKSEYSVAIFTILKKIAKFPGKSLVLKKISRHIWTLLFSLVAVFKLVFQNRQISRKKLGFFFFFWGLFIIQTISKNLF